ncbi:hypothetical protein A2767_00085 [Candidatus Roizmanbacteria bacterium RIFCSPHIGHO2_01_FULL_35_10]|uniref:Purine nucleoside phosphorylase n=1 Tax=Candidatus Roizmanbacteria bacterium RIFCSPLOWO2_01_FULL_35_13 TaxID=1802055 RepID=A0A1F7IHC1_9BACT|nr:MAG: hypothetical protein A2767_00085 [Candidatus Roizmanbacteria bacterium RIFCSPHIGHO2_01_FULL_35_10]OGK42751.1 MAG: hypothetical protein A3A74_00875 [Candidatus Roizmanbacteria bacterium RIFCSPLOWO2_01_FULL_35_13]
MIVYNSDLKIFCSTQINDGKFFSGFSTSDLGDARNLNIVTNFFNQQNIPFTKLIYLEQIHSINVEILENIKTENNLEILKDSDGVITNNLKTILIVRNADCVPLIITDKTRGYIGISHQGWRGSLKNMSEKMVNTFLNLGSKVEYLTGAIGPAIGACCYDVDDDHYYEFLEQFEEFSEKIFMRKKGRWHINLALLNYLQLVKSGVSKKNIDFFPFCTKCDSKRFFSRRRAKSKDFPEMFNFIIKIK